MNIVFGLYEGNIDKGRILGGFEGTCQGQDVSKPVSSMWPSVD